MSVFLDLPLFQNGLDLWLTPSFESLLSLLIFLQLLLQQSYLFIEGWLLSLFLIPLLNFSLVLHLHLLVLLRREGDFYHLPFVELFKQVLGVKSCVPLILVPDLL